MFVCLIFDDSVRTRATSANRGQQAVSLFLLSSAAYTADKNDIDLFMAQLERGFSIPIFGMPLVLTRPLLFKALTMCWGLFLFFWRAPGQQLASDNWVVLSLLHACWPLSVVALALGRFFVLERKATMHVH